MLAAPGGGKTALAEVLFGRREPTAGLATLDGLPPRDYRPDALRRHVAVAGASVGGGAETFTGTVAENVHLERPRVTSADVRTALVRVGLEDAVDDLPGGVDTMLTAGGAPLSEVQLRRLVLARALAGGPRLLVIDSLLDGLAVDDAADLLNAARGSHSVLLLSRRFDVLAACDRVVAPDGTPLSPSPAGSPTASPGASPNNPLNPRRKRPATDAPQRTPRNGRPAKGTPRRGVGCRLTPHADRHADPFAMPDDRTQSSLLLTERAYRERALPALRLAKASRLARLTGKVLLGGLMLAVVAMFFAPWQQSVAGSGSVIAYNPSSREQVVQAVIDGRIIEWADGIRENDRVQKGQFVVELADIDDQLLSRLEEQVNQSERYLKNTELARDAAKLNKAAAEFGVTNYESNVASLKRSLVDTLEAYARAIEGAEQKVKAEEQALEAANATLVQAKADHDRKVALFGKGLVSELKFQEAEQKYLKAFADVAKHEAYLEDARLSVQEKRSEQAAKKGELEGKLDEAGAKIQEAKGKVAMAEAKVQKSEGYVRKARKDLLDAESKEASQGNQRVVATADGFITKLIADGGTGYVKKGDPLFTLVPDVDDRAVQIWLDGNDAPLVAAGRHVRLQFEGWPAVQTAGWPSVAVGTFGGEVATVDAVDDGNGRFRALVVPDPTDGPWPEPRFLRQGVRANGWVLLEQVTLGYEMWRRMNGFPPVLKDAPGSKTKGAAGPVKLQKKK